MNRIDPRLMRQSPEILALCSWLEKPTGRRTAYWALSIPPATGIVLDVAQRTRLAIRVVAVGVIFQAVAIAGMFYAGGKSLMRAIDESLRQYQEQLHPAAAVAAGGGGGRTAGGEVDVNDQQHAEGGDESLRAAKKKVKRMMIFAVQTAAMVFVMLLFAVCTEYGVAAPLLLFILPMAYVPLVWNIVHIQLHAGRSTVRGGSSRRLISASGNFRRTSLFRRSMSRRASSVYRSLSGKLQQQVVPTR